MPTRMPKRSAIVRSKYGVRTDAAGKEARTVDGVLFDSMKEAKRYQDLKLLVRSGEVRELQLKTKFPIAIEKNKICVYVCDFDYFNVDWKRVVEDVKGVKTAVYRLKKKLVKAIYGIEIQEV